MHPCILLLNPGGIYTYDFDRSQPGFGDNQSDLGGENMYDQEAMPMVMATLQIGREVKPGFLKLDKPGIYQVM
ncbi:MAG: hypothetical protein R2764_10915 [Bacteroidales bacterium]